MHETSGFGMVFHRVTGKLSTGNVDIRNGHDSNSANIYGLIITSIYDIGVDSHDPECSVHYVSMCTQHEISYIQMTTWYKSSEFRYYLR